MVTKMERDAKEFGVLVKQGGWRLGLLVARNVIKAPGRIPAETLAPKTNATAFAEKSSTSPTRVLRYLEAWENAATAELVPHAADLHPGGEIELDAETLPDWESFYRATAAPKAAPPRPRATLVHAAPPLAPLSPSRSDYEIRAAKVARETALAELEEARAALVNTALVEAELDHNGNGGNGERGRYGHPPITAADAQEELHQLRRHADLATEASEAIQGARSYARRLFDLARDPQWPSGEARTAAADSVRNLAEQLVLVAEVLINPDSVKATDEALNDLLGR